MAISSNLMEKLVSRIVECCCSHIVICLPPSLHSPWAFVWYSWRRLCPRLTHFDNAWEMAGQFICFKCITGCVDVFSNTHSNVGSELVCVRRLWRGSSILLETNMYELTNAQHNRIHFDKLNEGYRMQTKWHNCVGTYTLCTYFVLNKRKMFTYIYNFIKACVFIYMSRRRLVGAHGGRSGHLVLFLVALLFSKLNTLLSNNPEGNPLKAVYLTPKIALKFRGIGCRNGRLVTIAICFSHSLFRATKLVFMANYSYCRGA